MDDLRQLISNKKHGINVVHLKSSNIIPQPIHMSTKNDVNLINPKTDMLWLHADKSSYHKSSDKNHYYCNWDNDMFDHVSVTDKNNERVILMLDRYPKKKHSFVSLVQLDKNWANDKGRNKIIEYGLLGVSLYHNKNRSNNTHPNLGYQLFTGYHRTMRELMGEYVTRKSTNNYINHPKYKVSN